MSRKIVPPLLAPFLAIPAALASEAIVKKARCVARHAPDTKMVAPAGVWGEVLMPPRRQDQ